jgi:ketosteroid isomerase-like protein
MRLRTPCLLWLLLLIGTHGRAFGQQALAAEITKLDNLEREAVIKADTGALLRLWSPDILINNPQNRISTRAQVLSRIRQGLLDYTSFERTIEKLSIIGDIVVVMGQEVLHPARKADYVGKTVTRRFTNVWMQQAGTWRLVARQATIVSLQ